MEVVNYHVYASNNVNLLAGKDLQEIEEFATGKIDMNRYKRMFKSLKKSLDSKKLPDGTVNEALIKNADTTGLSWEPLALIPQKLNSAISTVQKIPIEVQCVAMDGLAMQKRKEDLEFLKSKPLIEADLQDIADQMGIGKVDIGSTKHSSRKFSEAPLGLDLSDPDEEDVFSKLLYSLNVETSFEKLLQQFYLLKKANQVKLLEITDTFKFGIQVNQAFPSAITGLPDLEYVYPGDMETPKSRLPDYSDNTHRIIYKTMTVLEMFNFFGDEIRGENHLEEIMNGRYGYCECHNRKSIEKKNWGTTRLTFKYIEVRSIDSIGVYESDGSKTFTDDDTKMTKRIWGQNTYGFWWLVNTKMCFGIHVLPGSYRTLGQESIQNFSTNIYKSQPKSAVELSIGENKKAQIADIKLEHALIMSLPAGRYIDLRPLRNAVAGLKAEKGEWTQTKLIELALEKNLMIGDTEGFEGKNDGQFKPIIPIPGGLLTELTGYINTIMNADRNISNFTGINEQLTGQSPNPDMLVGLQKLLINSGLNSIYYCNEAVQANYTAVFHLWANYAQAAIERGGKTREAIVDMIGEGDTNLLDGLDETPLHNITTKVLVGQREIERQMYQAELERLKKLGILNAGDEYVLSGIDNPKERFAFMAVKEKKWMKKQDQMRQEQFVNQQQIVQQQGQNEIQTRQVQGEIDVKKEYAKGDVQANLLQLANQLGLSKSQTEGVIKMALQRDRNVAQKDKAVSTIREKQNVDLQQAL